jgi:hypothetical protein
MGEGVFRRIAAAAAVAVLFGIAMTTASTKGVTMEKVKASVAAVAAATTVEEERERLGELREALASSGASFAVHLRQRDGTEKNLATSRDFDADASIVFTVHLGGETWASDPFTAEKIENYYVLFRE